ncbi:MAG: DUF4465 domain-containing protein [Bacteroidales bacterium]|nr:DUF4465 domain-containing protein [Bacteroidales bacterium]
MKRTITFLGCALCALTALAQEDYELRVLTFEDADYKGDVNFANDYNWSSLIDNPQYYGPLLYPADFDDEEDEPYNWWDQNNTEIYSELTNAWGDGSFWGGGIAISNYIDDDLSNGDYLNQLAVPVPNGSSNFAVVYCNSNPTIADANPQTWFAFSKSAGAHVIESALVGPTTYQLNTAKNDNSFGKTLTEVGDYMTVTFHGYNNGEATGTVSFDLARDGNFLEEWTEVPLVDLGEVDKVLITIDSNDKSGDYVNQASYFAMDNIKVRFPKTTETGIVSVGHNTEVKAVEIFTIDGQKVESLQKGINIIKTYFTDGSVKVSKRIVK